MCVKSGFSEDCQVRPVGVGGREATPGITYLLLPIIFWLAFARTCVLWHFVCLRSRAQGWVIQCKCVVLRMHFLPGSLLPPGHFSQQVDLYACKAATATREHAHD